MTIKASTSAACSGEADERSTWRALLSQLGSPDVLLLAGGLVLPNLLSFATLISLLDIGLPTAQHSMAITPAPCSKPSFHEFMRYSSTAASAVDLPKALDDTLLKEVVASK